MSQDWKDAQGVGDVSSDKKGSGARFNSGKPPMELLPIRQIAQYYAVAQDRDKWDPLQSKALLALSHLGEFQEGNNDAIYRAMHALGDIQESLVECALVFDYGRHKYAEWNWAKGMSWSIPLACAVRHLLAILRGEYIDPIDQNGSGLSHLGHVMCNLMMLSTFMYTFSGGDDRPSKWLRPEERL